MAQSNLYQVYILQNNKGIFYIGLSEDIALRLEQHNCGISRWTRSRGPWSLVCLYPKRANRASPQKAEGWPWLLQTDRLDQFLRLIIPQGRIPGSNPGPATNFNPAYSAGFFYGAKQSLPGYILQNNKGIFYIGLSEDIALRLEQHNSGISNWTRSRGPWSLVWASAPCLYPKRANSSVSLKGRRLAVAFTN